MSVSKIVTPFLGWFKTAFKCLKDEDQNKFPHPLQDWLMRALENFICVSSAQRVLIFLLLARSMGWPTRLVMNLDTISVKPEKSLGADLTNILGSTSHESKDSKKSSEGPKKEVKNESSKDDKKPNKEESDGESPSKKSKKDNSKPSKSKSSKQPKATDDNDTGKFFSEFKV